MVGSNTRTKEVIRIMSGKDDTTTIMPKIKIVKGKWDGAGKMLETNEIEVRGHTLKECEKTVDKYRK